MRETRLANRPHGCRVTSVRLVPRPAAECKPDETSSAICGIEAVEQRRWRNSEVLSESIHQVDRRVRTSLDLGKVLTRYADLRGGLRLGLASGASKVA